jgi:hypothetical protein
MHGNAERTDECEYYEFGGYEIADSLVDQKFQELQQDFASILLLPNGLARNR